MLNMCDFESSGYSRIRVLLQVIWQNQRKPAQLWVGNSHCYSIILGGWPRGKHVVDNRVILPCDLVM